jgi:hypothetical protein
MEEKLSRLEAQMKRLLEEFRETREKNDELRKQNERLLNDLLEKSRQLDVLEERAAMLIQNQAEKRKLIEQRDRIRVQVRELLDRIRALKVREDKT